MVQTFGKQTTLAVCGLTGATRLAVRAQTTTMVPTVGAGTPSTRILHHGDSRTTGSTFCVFPFDPLSVKVDLCPLLDHMFENSGRWIFCYGVALSIKL